MSLALVAAVAVVVVAAAPDVQEAALDWAVTNLALISAQRSDVEVGHCCLASTPRKESPLPFEIKLGRRKF
jgi:hypothetical protein